MTGYGSAQADTAFGTLAIEVKALNSRGLELSTRLPRALSERDLDLRALLTRTLLRGKLTLNVELTPAVAAPGVAAVRLLDSERLRAAVQELTEAAAAMGAPLPDPLALALTLPGVVRRPGQEALVDGEPSADPVAQAAALWAAAEPLVQQALAALQDHRRAEGSALETELRTYGQRIRQALADVNRLDPQRVAAVRERLRQGVAELTQPEKVDHNRFEQELLYYIEKLDIEEEKVRLTTHLNYYDGLLTDPEPAGKKLGFLAQEIGREINTIGSKANDAAIQHLVVTMKEELEKMKEQLNNVL